LLREIKSFWNRYRKTTRENAVYYQFKITDLKSEFESDLIKVGDNGKLGVFLGSEEAQYNVSQVNGWDPGEPRVWVVISDSIKATKTSSFFSRP
jgi:hypothetical protein